MLCSKVLQRPDRTLFKRWNGFHTGGCLRCLVPMLNGKHRSGASRGQIVPSQALCLSEGPLSQALLGGPCLLTQ